MQDRVGIDGLGEGRDDQEDATFADILQQFQLFLRSRMLLSHQLREYRTDIVEIAVQQLPGLTRLLLLHQ